MDQQGIGAAVKDEARRVIAFIENFVATSDDKRVGMMAAYRTACQFPMCGPSAWQIVNAHFGLHGRQLIRATPAELRDHFGRIFGWNK